jgi:hypothetical protein
MVLVNCINYGTPILFPSAIVSDRTSIDFSRLAAAGTGDADLEFRPRRRDREFERDRRRGDRVLDRRLSRDFRLERLLGQIHLIVGKTNER